ncbi:MAG: AsmA-like C-terminal region-containing protein [Planctomycetaceae bacterium]|nr:AsmA-like C-terminal region-containing protein [Planctomycetaceae bacterium]
MSVKSAQSVDSPKPDSSETEDQSVEQPRGRWGRIVFWGLLLLVLAPSLLTVSGKHTLVMQWIGPEFAKAVKYRSVSLHWWSPVEFTEVSVRDLSVSAAAQTDDRQTLLTIASVRTKQPLWRLALSGGDRVTVDVVNPQLNLKLADGQTNLEETLRRMFPEESQGGSSLRYEVRVTDGAVHVSNGRSGHSDAQPLLFDVQAAVSTLSGGSLPVVSLTASLDDGQPRGRLVDAEQRTRVAARLEDVRADFASEPLPSLATEPHSDSHPLELQIAAPDEKNAQKMELSVRQVSCERLQPFLQRFFPDVVCSGRLSLRLQTRLVDADVRGGLAGRLQLLAENLRWRRTGWVAGEMLRLDQLAAEGIVAIAEDGILLEGVRLDSDVLTLQGDGQVRYVAPDPAVAIARSQRAEPAERAAEAASHGVARLNGKLDVAALSWMLPETLGIRPGVKLSEADIDFAVRVLSDEREADTQLDPRHTAGDFQWHLDVRSSPVTGRIDNREVKIDSVFAFDAHGRLRRNDIKLDRAAVQSPAGELKIAPRDEGFHVAGRLSPARLWSDFQAILDLPPPGLRGDVDIVGDVLAGGATVELRDVKIAADELEIVARQLSINTLRPVTEMLDGAVEVRGYAAAIKMLIAPWHDASWLSDASTIAARLTASSGRQIDAVAVVKGGPSGVADPNAMISSGRFEGRLIADQQTGSLHVEQGTLEIPGLRAEIRGTLGIREELLHAHLTADTQYDLSSLSRQFLSVDGSLMLTGQGRQTFELTGAPSLLTPDDLLAHQRLQTSAQEPAELLTIRGGLAWDGGRLYGTQMGGGQVDLQLVDGVLTSSPIQCALSGGQLNVMPRWRLQENVIELASGARVSGLPLTTELASTWLGYVSPMLAESAAVQGVVSARLQQFAWFLDTPRHSLVDGVLSIQQASAAAGPSLDPVIRVLELVGRQDLAGRQLVFPSQDVRIHVAQGIVEHDQLQMDLNDYQIATSGRIGLDERVDLTLSVPLEKGANSRRVQIPVRGTIRRPVPAMDGLLQNLGQQELRSRLDGELNRQLDKGLNRLLDKLR